MATPQSLQFVHFTFPSSKAPFCNNNLHKPTATLSQSKYQTKIGINTAARATINTHLPSLEKESLVGLRPKISAESSNAGSTLQCLEEPALYWARLQVNRTQSGSGEPQDSSRDQSVILDGNHHPVEVGAGNESRNAADTFTTPELASESHSVPSTPAQVQAQTLPQSSKPLEDQITQQVFNITQCTSVDSALPSIAKASDSDDDRWNDENTAELERELELALGEQLVEPLSVGTSITPSPQSVEALQDEIQSREGEITESILKELRNGSRRGNSAQDLERCKQRETQVVEGGFVAMQQQKELVQPSVGDVQNLVEVKNTNNHEDKEATEALPATQPNIDEQRFRLRGVRTRQLPGRQTKITQYRVVWGQRPNRSDSWLNENDIRMSMPWPPCELHSQNSSLSTNIDIIRVCEMRSSGHKGRKVVEYLVAFGLDKSTWITQGQLRISLSPMLVLELKGSSPHPLSEAQRDVLLRHSATPMGYKHSHASRASRSSSASASADPALDDEPATRKRRHEEVHTKIISDTHHSTNTDDNHDAYDTSDEDPRPAKRRKPRSAPAVTPPPHLRPTTGAEIDESHSQDDDECSLNSIEEQYFVSRTSRSLSAAAEAVPAAIDQEWPFQGFLKRTRIGNITSFNLEFHLVNIEEDLDISRPALGSNLGVRLSAPSKSDSRTLIASSKQHIITSGPSKKRAPSQEALVSDRAISTRRGNELNKSQESLLAKMIQENKTWTEIRQHFPDHPLQLLKDNFFKNQGGKPRKRGRKPGVKVGGA